MTDIKRHFGRNLSQARREKGLSQSQLSRRAGMHLNAIQKIEHGGTAPRLDTLLKLKCSLDVSADELLAGLAWKPESETEHGCFLIVDEGEP